MEKIEIAKSLKQAFEMGRPELAADLIRQKLSIAQFQLEEGMDPFEVLIQFQAGIGMGDFPVLAGKRKAA